MPCTVTEALQALLHKIIGGCGRLDKERITVGVPVQAVQHQAVQVDVEVGSRSKALDQRNRASVGAQRRAELGQIG